MGGRAGEGFKRGSDDKDANLLPLLVSIAQAPKLPSRGRISSSCKKNTSLQDPDLLISSCIKHILLQITAFRILQLN